MYDNLPLADHELGRYGTKTYASRAEQDEIYLIQERAREVLEMNRRPMPEVIEESALDYRKEICRALLPNTTRVQKSFKFEGPQMFADTEKMIYEEARERYLKPLDVPAGQLVEIKRRDHAGRVYSEFGTGQKGIDPRGRPASAFKALYGDFMARPAISPICLNGEPLPPHYRG